MHELAATRPQSSVRTRPSARRRRAFAAERPPPPAAAHVAALELAHFAPNQSESEPCAELGAELYDTEANVAGGGAGGDGLGGRQPLACSTCHRQAAHRSLRIALATLLTPTAIRCGLTLSVSPLDSALLRYASRTNSDSVFCWPEHYTTLLSSLFTLMFVACCSPLCAMSSRSNCLGFGALAASTALCVLCV